ncbi:MAG: NnrU family protein [Pseudomonadota bacterium]
MSLLLFGMALFFAAHLFPRLRTVRAAMIDRVGAGPYKIGYTAVSLVGLVVIILGYRQAPFTPVYEPASNGRAIAHALMPFAFILLAGANMKSNLKRYVRHPMLWGVLLWAATHLSANGDLASVILFGGFGLYAAVSMILTSAATPTVAPPQQPQRKDLILIGAGVVAYAAVIWAHGAVFGVYVVG